MSPECGSVSTHTPFIHRRLSIAVYPSQQQDGPTSLSLTSMFLNALLLALATSVAAYDRTADERDAEERRKTLIKVKIACTAIGSRLLSEFFGRSFNMFSSHVCMLHCSACLRCLEPKTPRATAGDANDDHQHSPYLCYERVKVSSTIQ